jgi:glycerol-3-phosphate dehydrogenase (NAD(P)+)
MKHTITILGAGRIGSALQQLLEPRVETVHIWDVDEKLVPDQKPLKEIIPVADLLFLCIPSWVTREALESTKPFLSKSTIIISLAKGIEHKSGLTIDKVIEDATGHDRYALIYGPMLAEELKKDLNGFGVIATKDFKIFKTVDRLFEPTALYFEHSSDIRGVAIAGILKNIYALALGIADGLDWGGNTKGWVVSHAVLEMESIVQELGGKKESVAGPAGIGDLIASGFSPYSKNRSTGHQFVSQGEQAIGSEGAVSLPSLLSMLGDKEKNYPLLQLLKRIIMKQDDPKNVLQEFIKSTRH